MEHRPTIFPLGWILLPLVAALALGVAPVPLNAQKNYARASEAALAHQPAIQVDALHLILEVFPERGDLWERAGASAMDAGQSSLAIRDLKQANSIRPMGLDGLNALGDAYQNNGDSELALATWNQAIHIFGPREALYSRITRVTLGQKDYANTLRVFQEWSNWQPNNPQVLYQTGLILVTRHPQDAISILLKAQKLDASLAPAVGKIQSRVYSADGSADPAYALLQAGRALGELGEWRLAEEAFNQAVIVSPNYAEAWAFLGEVKEQLSENGQSEIDRAMALNSNSVLVMALQAISMERHGKASSALVYLHAIADKEPATAIWQVEIAHALVQMGDLQTALGYYQKAVQVEPDNPAIWRELANYCLIYNNQLNRVGLPAARKAVVLAPNDSLGLDLLGQILVELGDYYSADRFFWRAIQNNPDNAAIYLHRGIMYLDQRDGEKAHQSLQRALDLAANQPDGKQAQRLLDRYFPK